MKYCNLGQVPVHDVLWKMMSSGDMDSLLVSSKEKSHPISSLMFALAEHAKSCDSFTPKLHCDWRSLLGNTHELRAFSNCTYNCACLCIYIHL